MSVDVDKYDTLEIWTRGRTAASVRQELFGVECALGCNRHSVSVRRHTEQSQARLDMGGA